MENNPRLNNRGNRLKTAAIHLIMSLVVLVGFTYLVVDQWFPSVHFRASNGLKAYSLITLFFLTLGPFLTLIIAGPDKTRSKLKLDLAIIGTAQLLILIFGGYMLQPLRPGALVFNNSCFIAFPIYMLETQDGSAADLRAMDGSNPPMLFVKSPKQGEEEIKAFNLFMAGLPVFAQFWLLEPFQNFNEQTEDWQLDPSTVPEAVDEYNAFKAKHSDNLDTYRFLPFISDTNGAVLVFSERGEIVTTFGPISKQVMAKVIAQAEEKMARETK